MLTKLCAKLCCAQADGDADKAEPAIPHARRSINEGGASLTKSISPEVATTSSGHAAASPKDLWQVAFDNLDPKQKQWLSKEEHSPTKVIQEVISETETKYTEYKKKELIIRKHNGGEIKVREIAQNILAAALNVQQIITAIVSFDPSGHASSAWTIVSLGLTMVQRDIARRDAILEASEFLAEQLAYFSFLDSDRRYTNGAGDKQLDSALVGVYTAILEYTAEVKKIHHESGFARIGSTLIPLTEQPLQKLRTVVENKITMAEKWATVTDRTYLKGQAADILAAIDKTVEELQKVQSTVLSRLSQKSRPETHSLTLAGVEDKGILEWLSQYDFSKAQNDTQDHRSPGTGDWLLKLKAYVEWKDCPGSIFWLHGVVIGDVQRTCLDSSNMRLAYWYFQFNDPGSQRVENMLRAIIRQLHSNPLDGPVRRIWKEHGTKGSNPSNVMLQETLHKMINAYQGNVFLILDALDECPNAVNRKERSFLLAFLTELQEKCSDNIHILVTSRPEPDIIEHLEWCTALDLEEKQGSDILAFVKVKVEALDDRIAPKEVKTQIIHELLQDDKRRFRWADLQIKRLEECRNNSEILESLKTMPQTLHDIYISVIERINSKRSDIIFAKKILTWLCFCARPLTLTEVAAAAGLGVPEDIIKICTTSFVTYRRMDDEIRLAHFSVKEFLVSSQSTGQWHQLSTLNGHAMLAKQNLRILLQNTRRLLKEEAKQELLLDYAACNWHEHFKVCAVTTSLELEKLQEMVNQLFRHPTIYRNWRYISTEFEEQEVQPSPIGAASELGLIQTVNGLLEEGADPLKWFAYGSGPFQEPRNAVLLASENGHLDVLDLLLHKVFISLDLAEGVLNSVQRYGLTVKTLEDIFDTLSASGILYTGTESGVIHIDERIVVAAAKNERCGMDLMAILLDQYEETGVAIVPVTEDVLETVLRNRGCGGDVLQVLLKRRNADVKIYPQIKKMLACPALLSDSAIVLLLAERRTEIDLDEKFIAGFAQYASETAMEVLLSTLNDDFLLAENVLVGAANNGLHVDVLRQILRRRQNRAQVSEDVLCTAVCNTNAPHCLEMLELLLDDCGPDFSISEKVMLKIVNKWIYAAEILNMLLHRQQAGFTVTHAILCQAASNPQGKDIFEILMNNGGLRISITEDILLNSRSEALICFLLDLEARSQIEALPLTEKVMSHAVRRFTTNTVKAIFRVRPMAKVSDNMFVEACSCDSSMLALLMKQPHGQLPVSKMLITLEKYGNHQSATEIIQLLLDRKLFEVDQGIVERFAHNHPALELLLRTAPCVCITEKAAIRAAAASHEKALCILLDERIEDIPISEEFMIAVAGAERPTNNIRRILAHCGPQVPITEKVLLAASYTLDAFQLLLHALGPDVPPFLTEKVVMLATYQKLSALPWLIERYGFQALPLTERVMVAAAATSLSGLQWLLHKWPAEIDFNDVWRAIWRFERNNCDYLNCHKPFILPTVQYKAASHIVRYTRAVDLSEEVFQSARNSSARDQDSIKRHYSGLMPLIEICIMHSLPVPVTERLVKVFESCDADLIEAIREAVEKYGKYRRGPAGELDKMLLSCIQRHCGTSVVEA
ncbi:hypothetical protein ASPNIDRAFT_53269 [Aspergillus niger ATCC 1015]|uniref:NACHT domain-containing protein n=1 Tax=Aspergillus niger (strain ATCC 1015 / CBS 113.46 / FGSC A1144 / LSHB Ac4 / NCTC 3858a / NRRL 328 / USDA 3528.7) TaxID=380704 RepID=G3XYQ4_ASPNA|nr:hypothetical protein ASPNIDRAFT_53269 [Aspergillus niger ATCC 1015]